MTTTYDLIRQAIIDGKQVTCSYDGLYRECCPHAIGTKGERENVLMFQFAGESSKKLPPSGQWKCMHVDLIEAASVQDGPWHTDDVCQYSRTTSCLDLIDCDVLSSSVGA